jgi:hypothetical protein
VIVSRHADIIDAPGFAIFGEISIPAKGHQPRKVLIKMGASGNFSLALTALNRPGEHYVYEYSVGAL